MRAIERGREGEGDRKRGMREIERERGTYNGREDSGVAGVEGVRG